MSNETPTMGTPQLSPFSSYFNKSPGIFGTSTPCSLPSIASIASLPSVSRHSLGLESPLLQSPSSFSVPSMEYNPKYAIALPKDRVLIDYVHVVNNFSNGDAVTETAILSVALSNPTNSLLSLPPTRLDALAKHGTVEDATARSIVTDHEKALPALLSRAQEIKPEVTAAVATMKQATETYDSLVAEETSIATAIKVNRDTANAAAVKHRVEERIQAFVAALLKQPAVDRPWGLNSDVTIDEIKNILGFNTPLAIHTSSFNKLIRANYVMAALGFPTHRFFQGLLASTYWVNKYRNKDSFVTSNGVSKAALADRICDYLGFFNSTAEHALPTDTKPAATVNAKRSVETDNTDDITHPTKRTKRSPAEIKAEMAKLQAELAEASNDDKENDTI